MKEIHRQLASGAAASVVLGLFSVWTAGDFSHYLLLAIAIGLGVYLVLPKSAETGTASDSGVSRARLAEALARIDIYSERFTHLSRRTRDHRLREPIDQIRSLLENISERLENEPKSVYMDCTTLFLDRYLPASHELIRDTVRLWNHATEAAIQTDLKPTEAAAHQIVSGYAAFHRQCLLDGLVDLKAGNQTLETLLEKELAPYDRREGVTG